MNELKQKHYNVGKDNPMYGKKRPEHRLNITGINNPMHGRKHSKKTILKMSETRKNKHLTGENNPNYKDGLSIKETFCVDCNKPICSHAIRCWEHSCEYRSKRFRGKKHHRWLGGLKSQEYGINWSNKLKRIIRKRDNYICQNKDCNCIQNENGRKLDVHHIDYDKKNCIEENLISLCISCHMKSNTNREYWVEYFKNMRGLLCPKS